MLSVVAVFALLVISQSLVSSETEQKKDISVSLSPEQVKQFNSEGVLNSVLEALKNGIEVRILNPSLEGNSLQFDLGFKRKSVPSDRGDTRKENAERGKDRKKKQESGDDESNDESKEQNDDDTIIHNQGFNPGVLLFGDSFEMVDTSMHFMPAVPVKPINVTCAALISMEKVNGVGCVKKGCCAGKQQVHRHGACPGRDVCCFSSDSCKQEPITQPSTTQPTTQPTTAEPIHFIHLIPVGPVDVRAPRDNCTGKAVQGSTSIGCIPDGCCEEHRQVASLCPGSNVCCFSKDFCAERSGCSRRSKQLACRILEREKDGLITLAMNHTTGHQDNAYPRLNLQNACNNQKSQRSSYSCPDSCKAFPAPSGSTCLSPKMLQYIESLIISRLNGIHVTAITGGCHKCGSKHYDGLAVNLKTQGDFQKFLSMCRSMGGKGLYSVDFINCQFFE